MIRVSSNNEWDTLEEVIVGRVEGARIQSEDPGLRMADFWHLSDSEPIPSGPFPERVVEETKEDLEVLAEALSSLGVIVHRPSLPQPERTYSSPHWSSDGLHSYCPRDTLLVVGDTIIETPMVQRSRQYETLPLRPILHECLRGGARWLSAPRPALLDDSWRRRNGFHIALNEHEPLFDAANVVRLGQDLLYLVSDSGNYLGARWLQSVLGSSTVSRSSTGFAIPFIDTTIVPVREGLVFVPAEFVRPDNLPEVLRDWEVVYFNEPSQNTPKGRPGFKLDGAEPPHGTARSRVGRSAAATAHPCFGETRCQRTPAHLAALPQPGRRLPLRHARSETKPARATSVT